VIIAGNWKMNMDRASAQKLAEDLSGQAASMNNNAQMIVFPPAILIDTVVASRLNENLQIGGQDCHAQPSGAHTGDISASMLVDAGCGWVLAGHSERRTDHHESNQDVAAKASAAIDAGLSVIICVGETLEERMAGKANDIVAEQIEGSLPADLPHDRFALAYEPVWAIGTGQVASPEDVDAMHNHIRDVLVARHPNYAKVDILYGGSVKPDNAAALLALSNVGGALVGGASLKADDFIAIAQST